MEEMSDQEKEQRAIRSAYRRVFKSVDGCVVLKDMMRNACFYETTMSVTELGGDRHTMEYREGMRAFVIGILENADMMDDEFMASAMGVKPQEETDDG